MADLQKKKNATPKRHPSPKSIRNWAIYLFFLFLTSYFLEWLAATWNGLALWTTLVPSILGIAGSVISSIIAKSAPAKLTTRKTGDLFTVLVDGVHAIFHSIWNDPKKLVVFFIAMSLLTSTAMAAGHVSGRILRCIYDTTAVVMDEVPEMENVTTKESVQPTTGISVAIPAPSVSPEHLPEREFELLDPERVYTLDQADYHSLYFLDGHYAIQNWEDEDEIEEKVFQCVQNYLEQELPNSFDDYAPESVKDEAARLSEMEPNLSNSQELQNLIEARKEIYQSYPKYSLAHMIAESYNRFGLEYIKINGNFSTIEYYYGHSIQWLLRALSFSAIDSDAVRTRLSSIQMRYHDIASRAPVGSESGEYAQKLCEAFKRVANRI